MTLRLCFWKNINNISHYNMNMNNRFHVINDHHIFVHSLHHHTVCILKIHFHNRLLVCARAHHLEINMSFWCMQKLSKKKKKYGRQNKRGWRMAGKWHRRQEYHAYNVLINNENVHTQIECRHCMKCTRLDFKFK